MKKIIANILLLSFLFLDIYPVFAHVGTWTTPTSSCMAIGTTDLITHSSNEIDTRIGSALAYSTSSNIFWKRGDSTTPTGATTTEWIRNPNVWTSNIDLTGVNAWNQMYNGYSGRYEHKATLISPKHFVTANHWGIEDGSTLAFIANDNTIVYRTVIDTKQVGTTDISVGVLDSDVPDSIAYYPIINYTKLEKYLNKYIPEQYYDFPIIGLNNAGKVFVHKMSEDSAGGMSYYKYLDGGTRAAFSELAANGDSGHPIFAIIDDKPILLSTIYSGNGGPNHGSYISQINQAITDLGNTGGYTVTEYNPTCFTEYVKNNIPNFTNSLSTTTKANSRLNIVHLTASDIENHSLIYKLDKVTSFSSSTLNIATNTYFNINTNTGNISQIADIDNLLTGNKLLLGVSVIDGGVPSAIKNATITVDIEYPKVDSAVRGNSSVDLTFNNILSTSTLPSNSDFEVKVNGVIRSVTSLSILSKTVSLILSSPATTGDTITVKYTPGTNKLKDLNNSFVELFILNVSNSRAGDLDTTFNIGAGFSSNVSPNNIVLDDQGRIYIGIDTGTAGYTYQGIPLTVGSYAKKLIRLLPDGTYDNTFNAGLMGLSHSVSNVKIHDNKIYVVGSFNEYASTTVGGIVRLNMNGTIDNTFTQGIGFNSFIADIIFDNNKIVLVGNPSTYNGVSVGKIVRLNMDGSLDYTFHSTSTSGYSDLYTITKSNITGKYYIGGVFDTINSIPNNFVARINTDGTLDTSFVSGLHQSDDVSAIYSIIEESNGNILVAGAYSQTYAYLINPVIRLSNTGSFIQYFGYAEESNSVTDIQKSGDYIYALGDFIGYTSGGYYRGLLAYDQNGNFVNTYNHDIHSGVSDLLDINGYPNKFYITPDGRYAYIAAGFTQYHGQTVNRLARIILQTDQDVTRPSLVSVSSASSSRSLGVGQALSFSLTYDEPVVVTGTPSVSLRIGTTTKNANYVSGSGTNTLYFEYIIQSGDNGQNIDFVNTTSLTGDIKDAANNDAILTLFTPGSIGSLSHTNPITIDTSLPVIFGANINNNQLTLVFSKDINSSNTNISGFTIMKNGQSITNPITNVSYNGNTVVFTLNTTFTHGDTASYSYTNNSSGIKDLFNNDLASFSTINIQNQTAASPTITNNVQSGLYVGGGSTGGTFSNLLSNFNNNTTKDISKSADNTISKVCTLSKINLKTNIKLNLKTNNKKQVKLLEQFLNKYEGENLKVNGIFEKSDRNAVNRFQEKYKNQILNMQGFTKATGIVAKKTIEKINQIITDKCI